MSISPQPLSLRIRSTRPRPASPNWTPQVLRCSALTGEGVEEVWQSIEAHHGAASGNVQNNPRPFVAGFSQEARAQRQADAVMFAPVVLIVNNCIASFLAGLIFRLGVNHNRPAVLIF